MRVALLTVTVTSLLLLLTPSLSLSAFADPSNPDSSSSSSFISTLSSYHMPHSPPPSASHGHQRDPHADDILQHGQAFGHTADSTEVDSTPNLAYRLTPAADVEMENNTQPPRRQKQKVVRSEAFEKAKRDAMEKYVNNAPAPTIITADMSAVNPITFPETPSPASSSSLPAVDPTADPNAPTGPKPRPLVEVINKQLFVDGKPFYIQGVCYSPIPIGESPSFGAKGDYFTLEYQYIWMRDLPLIKAMGATTIRIYGWNNNVDHTDFLNAVHAAGLKVLVTYYLGDATESPVRTQEDRNKVIQQFVAQVDRYADHPGILMWSFGNELNGSWNKFTSQFSDAFNCWWTSYCAGYTDTNSDCHWQSSCMYYQLFSWINAAAKAAKIVTTRPIISGFADVDYMVGNTPLLDKVARFDYLLPDLDAWAMQLYRGWTFGGYFWMFRGESNKAILVTEFGVDAYNDPCGWPENNQGGCFNMVGEGQGGDVAPPGRGFWGCAGGGDCARPGVEVQSEWDMRLAKELMDNYPDKGGVVWGGFLMAWSDEFWKGGGTQDLCMSPCKYWDAAWCRGAGAANYRPGGSAGCTWKAHFTCPNWDTNYHDLCGYWLAAAPDNYVNEEWFGITTPSPCWAWNQYGGNRLDTLYIRPAYLGMQLLWSGTREVDTSFTTCAALWPCWKCTQDHTQEELADGACAAECPIQAAATGPGASTVRSRIHQGGEENVIYETDFWSEYGTPLLLGAAVLAVAFVASGCVLVRKWRGGGDADDRARLLQTPLRRL